MESPPPPQPGLPWWATMIAVVITAVVAVMGTAYALGSGPKVPGGLSGPPGVGSLVTDTITYFPHILLLFGILADMFTYEGVYSIPSLVGLLSLVGNWVLRFFWKGLGTILEKATIIAKASPGGETGVKTAGPYKEATGTSTPAQQRSALLGRQRGGADAGISAIGKRFFQDYDGCTVQGFSALASTYAPQTLVVTATVFMYYIFDLVANRGWINALVALLFFSAIYVGQVYVIGNCPTPPGEVAYTSMQRALMALVEGMLMGGLSFSVVAAYYPTRLPSSVISPFPRKSRADLTVGPDGGYVDSEGNPYILLPNGQAVPDLSTAESRKTFAEIAGRNLGTKAPAMPGSCSTTQ